MKIEEGTPNSAELQRIYSARFAGNAAYRTQVWQVLAPFFGQYVPSGGAVLDLGAGYCEFINNVSAKTKYAMDLNPDVRVNAAADVVVLQQDCSEIWPLPDNSLDAVFTSNFLEHLPHKGAVKATLEQAHRCLKPGGNLIALGPNIKYLHGAYWDFFDHYVELSDVSLSEGMSQSGFAIERCVARFLPYTMSDGRHYPIWMLKLYLALPIAWPAFGKQFLIIGRKMS